MDGMIVDSKFKTQIKNKKETEREPALSRSGVPPAF
jgi:hypothetical protein